MKIFKVCMSPGFSSLTVTQESGRSFPEAKPTTVISMLVLKLSTFNLQAFLDQSNQCLIISEPVLTCYRKMELSNRHVTKDIIGYEANEGKKGFNL